MISKSNLILVLFLAIAICYLIWTLYAAFCKKPTEHFTSETLDDYEARMTVMKIFDTVLHRKPTPDEIDKYAKVTNEQDMLVAVLTDFNIATPTPLPGGVTSESSTVDATKKEVVVPSKKEVVVPSKKEVVAPPKKEVVAPLVVPSTVVVPPASAEAFAPVPSKVQNTYTSSNVDIDLKAIEGNLSSIMDSVNMIRSSLYLQTMCESEA